MSQPRDVCKLCATTVELVTPLAFDPELTLCRGATLMLQRCSKPIVHDVRRNILPFRTLANVVTNAHPRPRWFSLLPCPRSGHRSLRAEGVARRPIRVTLPLILTGVVRTEDARSEVSAGDNR